MPSRNSRMKSRIIEVREPVEKFYIFCEGEKTEPQYFESMKSIVASDPMYTNMIYIEGLGRNTLSVLQYAENYVTKHKIATGAVWCVYDRDDFPADRFNAVEQRMERLNQKLSEDDVELRYYAAWSNQCIEYWFRLHFEFYQTDGSREDHSKKLSEYLRKIQCGNYEKNRADIFAILTRHGNPKQAIKWANKRLAQCSGKTPADSVPATKVHKLVQELAKYFPEEYKMQYTL